MGNEIQFLFREALRLTPDYAMAQENLRNARVMQRKAR
jgi:hypothetical protein